jgi:two-component system KDP operon response regulator KdpE
VIVLDVAMPGMDGIEVCHKIREWTETPIIILSVKEDEKIKVRALDEGADDYITKPFSLEELLARVRVALRHAAGAPAAARILFTAAGLEVDMTRRIVHLRGELVKLTRTEYELLAYLIDNIGKVLSHNEILQNVWGTEYGGESEYVRVFIGQLRRKIEDDPSDPKFIVTVPRIGYRFVNPETSQTKDRVNS